MGELVLVRHGETEWSAAHKHTSVTDLPLTARGEEQAVQLGKLLGGRGFTAVLCSPRTRALRTADIAGLGVTAVVDDLVEWYYGEYEGLTTAAIRGRRAGWTLWRDGCPGGETAPQVGARADRVLAAVTPQLADGDVALIGHAHALRVLTARWLGLPPSAGGLFRLDVARISILGHEREQRVLLRWNSPS